MEPGHGVLLPDHIQWALFHGIEASELGFPLNEANQLLDPGYLPLESGFTRLDNGQLFVAVLTKMPKVNGKMIDWWLGWKTMETERYKLWHPRAHQAIRAKKMNSDEPRACWGFIIRSANVTFSWFVVSSRYHSYPIPLGMN